MTRIHILGLTAALCALTAIPAMAKMQPIVEGADKAPKVEAATAAKATPEQLLAETPVKTAPVAVFQATLRDVLENALRTNPALSASEQSIALAAEAVTMAATDYKPTIGASGSVDGVYSDTDPGSSKSRTPVTVGASLTQPIYRGGRTQAAVEQAQRKLDGARYAHQALVQQTLRDTATALLDVAQAQATVALNENNITVLQRQLDATSRNFEVGELTRTDVAQSKARVEGAKASLLTANANLAEAQARLKRLSGVDLSGYPVLLPDANDMNAVFKGLPLLPSTSADAAAAARAGNQLVLAAQQDISAANSAIRLAQGALLPELDLVAGASNTFKPASAPSLDSSRSASVGLSLTMPLYTGGKTQSAIRSATIAKAQSRDNAEDIAGTMASAAKTVFEQHRAAAARITALQAQVDADTQARAGTYREREVGTRTVLDTLDADQALLTSRTSLVGAVHDTIATRLSTLAAIGQLTPESLGLLADKKAAPAAPKVEAPKAPETPAPAAPAPQAAQPAQPAVAQPITLSTPERITLQAK